MEYYQEQLNREKKYLKIVTEVIGKQLQKETEKIQHKKNELVAARKDMYENTIHYSGDFEKFSDAIQFLNPIEVQTYDYRAVLERIEKYKKMMKSPYFARIDFTEDGFESESIYIGLGNLSDEKTRQTYICDWRAPISSIFYRYGLGKAAYKAPYGEISGEVTLKRQFEIKNGKIIYFFDSNITIIDDILKQALSQNSSAKMKSIVETIQREQDIIIRDIENDLLIVQGVAGSGKTSVALHRVAFLLYHGVTSQLNVNNIVLITPNSLFGMYIENVLPELGEKNIQTLTFEDMFENIFGNETEISSRNELIENIISIKDEEARNLAKAALKFKLSCTFIVILDRYIKHYEHRLIEFGDIFYNGMCIANRHLLKAELLNYKGISIPLEKRLAIMENRIMTRIQENKKTRLTKLEKFVAGYPEHIYEVKVLARLLSIRESSALKKEINKFTRIDAMGMLKRLTRDKNLFYKLAEGLSLPGNIEDILNYTDRNLNNNQLDYDDAMVLMCLKLKISGCELYKDIKQTVVDEAQDYYPLQYEILKLSFNDAKYTVMGDINQTIEKASDFSIYGDIERILNKRKSSTILMKKSFRCSYEINCFSSCFTDGNIEIESFDRHEALPQVVKANNAAEMEAAIIKEAEACRVNGYDSIAIICKSMREAEKLYKNIGDKIGADLIDIKAFNFSSKIMILPVYMAKGLEFDAVLVFNTGDENYYREEDKKLMYIACTRALHSLSLFYTGEKCRFIPDNKTGLYNEVTYIK